MQRLCRSALLWIAGSLAALAQVPRPPERGPIELREVVQRATLILRATVAASRVDWVGRTIYTFHDLIVSETVRGAIRTRLTIAVPGGAVGNVRTIWPGAPQILPGDEIVFLGTVLAGRSEFTAVGLFDGLIPVRRDPVSGTAVVSPRGRPENLEAFLVELRALAIPRP